MRVLLLLLLCVCANTAFSQDSGVRDPFVSPLRKADETEGEDTGSGIPKVEPPDIVLEGIIRGPKHNNAIIDGEVYKDGDQVQAYNARIVKIEKDSISILYQGVIFKKEIEREEE